MACNTAVFMMTIAYADYSGDSIRPGRNIIRIFSAVFLTSCCLAASQRRHNKSRPISSS